MVMFQGPCRIHLDFSETISLGRKNQGPKSEGLPVLTAFSIESERQHNLVPDLLFTLLFYCIDSLLLHNIWPQTLWLKHQSFASLSLVTGTGFSWPVLISAGFSNTSVLSCLVLEAACFRMASAGMVGFAPQGLLFSISSAHTCSHRG